MWRTGSSWLLSRFDRRPDCLSFYEPFNGEIGSRPLRARAARTYESRRLALRHPDLQGGYFAVYDELDPLSRQPLWRLAHPRLPLHDVYNGLSGPGRAMLEASCRLAASRARQPVFGFCHSGRQIRAMRDALGGRHLYLYRDPRDQFFSYDPRRNDFFVAATLLQVLATPSWREGLLPSLPSWAGLLRPGVLRELPHRASMRLGRRLWRHLPLPAQYQAFYLTWLASNEAGARDCDERVSLAQLQALPRLKDALAQSLAIDFDGLDWRPNPVDQLGLDFAALERAVEQRHQAG